MQLRTDDIERLRALWRIAKHARELVERLPDSYIPEPLVEDWEEMRESLAQLKALTR
jgi:hypothetical protein